MKAAVLYARLAPYHIARLQRAASIWAQSENAIHCVEVADRQRDYAWDLGEQEVEGFERTLLFPGEDYLDLRYLRIRKRMHEALNAIAPDVVVINGWGLPESWAAMGYCLRTRTPRVLVSDSQEIDKKRHRGSELVKQAFVNHCQAAFVAGAPHARYVQKLGMDGDCCFPGCDVVDVERFAATASTRTKNLTKPKTIRLISNLRLIVRKNVVGTLHALASLEIPWRWTITGDGPEREKIGKAIRREGLQGRVLLLGTVGYERIAELLGEHDAYFQPSLSEQWGLAVNEAMAAGLPVLVSKQCGCAEDLVVSGENGFVFDATDAGQLRGALKNAWDARDSWFDFGNTSLERIRPWSLNFFSEQLQRACACAMSRGVPSAGSVSIERLFSWL